MQSGWLLIGLCIVLILSLAAVLLLREQPAERFGGGIWLDPAGIGRLPYRLFVPPAAQSTGPLPLVVYLHGAGSRGEDNRAQLEHGALRFSGAEVQRHQPCFVLAPQCPPGTEWVQHGFSQPPFPAYELDVINESPHNRMLLALLDKLVSQLPIDGERLYLTGFSMGASGTWDLVCRHPERFAAAVPVSGVNDPGQAARLVDLPLRVYHGGEDTISPLTNAEAMVAAIRAAGGTQVELRAFPEAGHDVTRQAYGDPSLPGWLFAQRRRVATDGVLDEP